MLQRYEKFKTSRQEPLRLAIALEDFFLPELPEALRADYGAYLRRRILPAVEELIRQEALDRLDALQALGWIPLPQLDSFLALAGRLGKSQAGVWLLRLKKEACGFHRPDFSL